MKNYQILPGILLVLLLVVPAVAAGLPVDDANWSSTEAYTGTTNWSVVGTGTDGLAHVVVQNADELKLMYRNETPPGVLSAVVEIADRSTEPGTTLGYGPAIAVNGTTNEVYVSHFINTTSALEVGLASNGGGSWTNVTVDTMNGIAYQPGYRTAMTLDESGDAHIIFTNPSSDELTYVRYDVGTATPDIPEIIGTNAGPVSSIAPTTGGGLVVSYDDTAADRLMVIEYDGSSWKAETAYTIGAGETAIGTENAIAVGDDGYARVLFTAARSDGIAGDRLYLVEKTGSGWGAAILVDERVSATTYFPGVDIVMNGNSVHGVYAVSDVTNTTSSLRYLTDSSGTPETSPVADSTDAAYLFASLSISYAQAMPLIGTGYSNNAVYVIRPVFNPTFTSTPASGDAPLSVTVTVHSIVTPTGVTWDFGNGDTGTGTTDSTIYTDAGTYTIRMTATDGTATVTKEQTVSVTGGALFSDSGSSGLPEPEIHRASSTEPDADGNATLASFSFSSDPVKTIEILGYVIPEETTASVLTLGGAPDETTPSGTVWKYLEMSLAGIMKNDVLGAYVSFRIPEQVVRSYGYGPEDVALVHLTDDGWERLPTIFEKKEGAYLYYRAYTPGFSYFAIIFDEKASVRDLPELKQVIEENMSSVDEQTPTPAPENTPAGANTTATPESTATPIPSVTVPVPETTPTHKAPAPLAGIVTALGTCAAWFACRRE
ncbi:MAG TPA: PGF-pre-PGF domain-containing protein [Methanoculleus sp.]|nr:PGF-pre-PGF domain-containing protein [Methanoculleus sp.]